MEKKYKRPQRRYTRRPSAREQKKRLRRTFIGIGLVIIFAAATLGFRSYQLLQQKEQLEKQISSIQGEIEDAEAKNEELEKKKLEVTSDEYYESEARKRLGYVYEDELLIIPN